MIAQAATGVAGIEVQDDGSLLIDDDALDPEADLTDAGFESDAWVGLRAFVNATSERRGPIKVSLTGPVTFGVALHAAGVEPELAFRVAGAAVRRRATALLEMLDARLPQATVVAFLDEPAMAAAMQDGFPLGGVEAVDLVSSSLAAFERSAITGLHCCATPADWRLLMHAGAQVLSMPLDGGIELASGALATFLERGGWVAWGAVPTSQPIGTTVERLWRRLLMLWCELVDQGGCDPVLLRTQAMITPECGLAEHGITQAEQVLWFTQRLAERLQNQALSTRMVAGA
jgi:methionine synthase II (cobalamin-independent)